MIPFNIPVLVGSEQDNISRVFSHRKFSGSHYFTKACCSWFEDRFQTAKALLTPSCTHALEMSAILSQISPGDEVIMASFNFSSTANAFVLRGAKIVFVDIQPETMNLDENKIEEAITGKTKVILAMHYAGVSCEMNTIIKIAERYNLIVVEDAAQAIGSRYSDRLCGSIGDFGCFSFHETKNIQCGEGGTLLVNEKRYTKRAEIIQEKGTDRAQFFRGEIDKYSWVDLGSSFLSSELNAAFLYAQLTQAEEIIEDRLASWNYYMSSLKSLGGRLEIELPDIPPKCVHNGHIFWIKVADIKERTRLLQFLKENKIGATFHYIPLHSSVAGKKFGVFHGDDVWTTQESEKIIRLPLFYGLSQSQIDMVVEKINQFYG